MMTAKCMTIDTRDGIYRYFGSVVLTISFIFIFRIYELGGRVFKKSCNGILAYL